MDKCFMFTWEKSKQVISTQTLNENRIPMFWLGLFPVKAIPLILTSSLKAIIPQYHFLTLVLCHNCGLHCKWHFEAQPSGHFHA